MSLFQRTRKSNPPTEPAEYPAGICVVTPKGRFLIHRDGLRYKIYSDEIYRSWKFPLTVEATEEAVANYRISLTPLVFRDGTLIYNIKDATIYLVSEGKRRHVTSPRVLERLGAKISDVMVVSETDTKMMKLGEEIT